MRCSLKLIRFGIPVSECSGFCLPVQGNVYSEDRFLSSFCDFRCLYFEALIWQAEAKHVWITPALSGLELKDNMVALFLQTELQPIYAFIVIQVKHTRLRINSQVMAFSIASTKKN
jgi:hypothetical protein